MAEKINAWTRFVNWITGQEPATTHYKVLTPPVIVSETRVSAVTPPHPTAALHLTVPSYRQNTRRRLDRNPRLYTGFRQIGGNWYDYNSQPIFELDLIDVLNNLNCDSQGYVDPGPAQFLNVDIDNGVYVNQNAPDNTGYGFDSGQSGFQIGTDTSFQDSSPSQSYSSTSSDYSSSFSCDSGSCDF